MIEGYVGKIDVGVDLKYDLIVYKNKHCAPILYAIVVSRCQAPGLMSS